MKLIKDGVIQEVDGVQLNKYFAAGWVSAETEQAGDEVIRLKPAVKTGATVLQMKPILIKETNNGNAIINR